MNVFYFPRIVYRKFLEAGKNPKVIMLAVIVVLTHLFPEFGIVFKIDLFELPIERILRAVRKDEVVAA